MFSLCQLFTVSLRGSVFHCLCPAVSIETLYLPESLHVNESVFQFLRRRYVSSCLHFHSTGSHYVSLYLVSVSKCPLKLRSFIVPIFHTCTDCKRVQDYK